jgi:hypothetical protein
MKNQTVKLSVMFIKSSLHVKSEYGKQRAGGCCPSCKRAVLLSDCAALCRAAFRLRRAVPCCFQTTPRRAVLLSDCAAPCRATFRSRFAALREYIPMFRSCAWWQQFLSYAGFPNAPSIYLTRRFLTVYIFPVH